MSKRTQSSVLNIKFSVLNQIITLLLNFFNRRIFIMVLGNGFLGLNGLYCNILTVLSLADLGIGTALVYSFYQPLASHDDKKVSALVKFYKKVYNYIAAFTAVIGLSLVPFLHYIVRLEEDIPNIELYFLLFLINVILSYLFVYKTSILTADQSGYIITKYNLILSVIRIILQVLILQLTHSYFLYLSLLVVTTLLSNILLSRKTSKMFPYLLSQTEELSKNEKNSIFTNIKSLFVYKISEVFLNNVGNILISTILGTVWVGLYSNYSMITNQLFQMMAALFSSLTASVGNLIVSDSKDKLYRVFRELTGLSYIVAGVCTICVYTLINDFIRIWLGEGYVLSDLVLIAASLNIYISCILLPIWSLREASGLFVKTKGIMLAAAGLNLVFAVILGFRLGLAGILFAPSLARLCTNLWYEPKLLYRLNFNRKPFGYYATAAANMVIIAFLCLLFRDVTSLIEVTNWFAWVGKGVICFAGSFLLIVLIYSRTEMFQFLYQRMLSLDVKKLLKMVKQ